MVKIVRSMGMVGVRAAVGPTVVIDTFRAFTTAAVAADRGVALHVLAGSTDEARRIAASFDEPVLCGEVDGVRPDDFDLGNSPWDMAQYPIDGRTLVQATSSGTRCVVAAIRAGAAPVFAAAAVTASATAQAIADDAESVTIVSAGLGGLEPSDEDDLTGDLIAAVIGGASADPPGARHLIASCPRADQLRALAWAGPRDVDMCCDVDRFGFALEALEDERGLVRLVRRRPAASGILDRW